MRKNADILEKLAFKNQKPITYEEGIELKNEIKAVEYFECSAVTQEGLKEIFQKVVSIIVGPTKKKLNETKKSKCLIL